MNSQQTINETAIASLLAQSDQAYIEKVMSDMFHGYIVTEYYTGQSEFDRSAVVTTYQALMEFFKTLESTHLSRQVNQVTE